MRQTIQVAELLYFRPADRASAFHDPIVVDMKAFHTPVDKVDVEMSFQTSTDESGGSTARQQRRTAAGGDGTRRADADYWCHMLSGRGRFQIFIVGFLTDCEDSLIDLELNDDDLDVLREITEVSSTVNFGSTPRHRHFIATSSHGQSLEQVEMWRETVEV